MPVDEEYLQTVLRTFSHDAGSALRAASGFSKLLAERYGDNLDEKALNWLSLIRTESEKSSKQLKSLSQYARLYNVEDVSLPCDLAKLCADAQQEVAVQQALAECPSLTVEVSELPTIMGNPRAWQQYFTEMLVNCIRYASSVNGEPVLCRVFTEPSEKGLSLVIEDSGAGLTEEDIAKAVAPYRSLEISGQANGQAEEYGLSRQGMGFSIAKRIAELHGGLFRVSPRTDGVSGLRVEASLPA
jgi:light-regulated signal transduction histidine kinase (bacteriophytochrome)